MIKRISAFLIIIFLMISFLNINYGGDITLSQIVSTFNNCAIVKECKDENIIITATNTENKINVNYKGDGKDLNFEFILNGNILSTDFSENIFEGSMIASYLTDCVGQLHGYSDGETYSTLNSEQIQNYTVEEEGFEVSINGTAKIDITKKIPLADFSNTFIEISDLEDLKSFISGDGSAETSKGNIWFNKSGYDGKNTLLIAEKDNLTENTYKSILSIIQVMFNSTKSVDCFKENYTSISDENKEFNGFKIEVNPTKTSFEEGLIDDSKYKFIRITINKELVNASINNPLVKNDTSNSNANLTKIPKTGGETNYILFILYIIIVTCIITLVTILTKCFRKK